MYSKIQDPVGELEIKTEPLNKNEILVTIIKLDTKEERKGNSFLNENEYHVGIRLRCIQRGGKILNGDKVRYDCNKPVNKFEEQIEEAKIVEDNNNSPSTWEQN